MFTFKNWVALGMFVFGPTFLWMTRDFLANPREGTGTFWSTIQVLALVAIVWFSIAAWLVFKEASWEPIALASAVVGLAALVPYVVGVQRVGDSGDAGVQINIAVHVVGVAVVFALVLLPAAHDWLAKRI